MKKQKETLSERIRLEIDRHHWQFEHAQYEKLEVERALQDIERTKHAALMEFRRQEIKRLEEEKKQNEQARIKWKEYAETIQPIEVEQDEPEDGLVALHRKLQAEPVTGSLPPLFSRN